MWRCVAHVRTDVSEERMAFIIRVERISELGTILAVTVSHQRRRHFPRDKGLRLIFILKNPILKVFLTPQACRVISRMYKRRGKYQHTEEKLCILKFDFMRCPDTRQLPWPQRVICTAVLGNGAMKTSQLILRLNTIYSNLVNKPAWTSDISLLAASYLISL
jgi:hypothetical protein